MCLAPRREARSALREPVHATNLFAGRWRTSATRLDVLRQHCDDVGRDYDGEYAAIGVSQMWVGPDAADPVG